VAKALWPVSTNAEKRKRGEQTGLDTLVVHAVNDEYQKDFNFKANVRILRLSSTVAKLKFKEIDGDQQKWWNMWFNPIQRVTPYQR